jgi:NarL family two-component system response regulator YdfI
MREYAMNEIIRVLVVDDHLVVRKGLQLMLEEAGEDFELVGEAADGLTAIRLVRELQPEVVLMDIRMPGMDGLETIERMHVEWPQIAVLILTTYNEDNLVVRGLRAGACGYLLKDTNRDTLFRAIRSAARGEMLLQPEIMARVLSQTTSSAPSPQSAPGLLDLTEREREVLVEVARGKRSKEIATQLSIAESTVKGHLASIYGKLGVDSRASAVAVALERGLLPLQKDGRMTSH